MSYEDIRTGLIGTITLSASWSCNQIEVDGTRVLGSAPAHAMSIGRGAATRTQVTTQWVQVDWRYNLRIYTPWQSGDLHNTIGQTSTDAQSVIDILEQYPFLNNTSGVIDTVWESISAPEPPAPGRHETYALETLVVRAREMYDPSRQE